MAKHLGKSAATGHLLKTANGHLAFGCTACSCPSELECSYCATGATPTAFTVTFADVEVQTGCETCTLVGSSKVAGGTAVSGGIFSGTWTLNQDIVDPCLWYFASTGSCMTLPVCVEWYGTTDCTGAKFEADGFIISLEKTSATTFWLRVTVVDGANLKSAVIYSDIIDVANGVCCEPLDSANELTAYLCDDVGSGDRLGKNGTASLTPCPGD